MDYKYTKIKAIERIEMDEEDYVYDVVMEDSKYPYFFANNVLVHNSCHYLTHSDSLEMAKKVCEAVEKKVNESFPDFVEHAFNSKYNKILS